MFQNQAFVTGSGRGINMNNSRITLSHKKHTEMYLEYSIKVFGKSFSIFFIDLFYSGIVSWKHN